MRKSVILFVVIFILQCLPSHAVLKERDLEGTLTMLRIELTENHNKLERESGAQKEQRANIMRQLMTTMNRSQQNAIMLYSQKNGYVFDLTYACHEATEQYKSFRESVAPFRNYVENANVEIARYDSLITDLSSMYTEGLSEKAKIDRNVCLTLAVSIRRILNENRTESQQYINIYRRTENRLKGLNDYAIKRYSEIQASIFTNGGQSFFTILKNFESEFKETSETVVDKYKPTKHFNSDWDSRIILFLLGIIVFYGFLAGGLSYLVIGFIVTRLIRKNKAGFLLKWLFGGEEGTDAKDNFKAKRLCIILAATVVTFAAVLGVVNATVAQNFLIMASGLLVDYA